MGAGGCGAAADMAAGRGMLKSRGAGVKKCKSQERRRWQDGMDGKFGLIFQRPQQHRHG